LTENEMPSHTHDINLSDSDGVTRQEALGRSATAAGTETTSSTGGGAAHNNEPQYMDCVWVMRIY